MTKVESDLEGMKSELGDLKTMLGRIFTAVSGCQANNSSINTNSTS